MQGVKKSTLREDIEYSGDRIIRGKRSERLLDDGRIEYIKEFQTPEQLYKDLIDRVYKYHPSDDISMIEKAYDIAYQAHKEQRRKSGEPYIIHPLCVAIILADLELDKETIVAGLLHDVVEDTILTTEQITDMFGSDVALLVDGVTKLQALQYNGSGETVKANILGLAGVLRLQAGDLGLQVAHRHLAALNLLPVLLHELPTPLLRQGQQLQHL